MPTTAEHRLQKARMPLRQPEHGWTYAEYLKLDDDRRYEIIAGELVMAPAPSIGHQRVSRDLEYRLISFVAKHKAGEVFDAPIDVILSPSVVVQPDLVFISNERSSICQERGVFGAPDLVVEIISPGSLARDRHSKLKLYRKHGVKEYWLVDPSSQSVEVLVLNEEGEYDLHSSASGGRGRVKSLVLAGFGVTMGAIFSGK